MNVSNFILCSLISVFKEKFKEEIQKKSGKFRKLSKKFRKLKKNEQKNGTKNENGKTYTVYLSNFPTHRI